MMADSKDQQQQPKILCVGGAQSEGKTLADFTACARAGHLECIRRLLERKPTATELLLSPAGEVALREAAVRGHAQVVGVVVYERLRVPLRLGAEDAATAVAELTCFWVTTPLRLACREGHEATARAILDLLPRCVVRAALRRHPPARTATLVVTAPEGAGEAHGEAGDAAAPPAMPEVGATGPHNGGLPEPPQQQTSNDGEGTTKLLEQCLLDAAGAGRANVVELLVERKADLTARVKGNLPVVLAASRGHTDATLALLSAMRRQRLLLQRTQGQCAVAGAVEVAELLAVLADDPALVETLESVLEFLARPARLAVKTFLLCNNRLDSPFETPETAVSEQDIEASEMACQARPAPGVSSTLDQSSAAKRQVCIRDQWIRFKIAMLALDQPVHDKLDWVVSAAHDPNQLQTPLMVAAEANNLRGVQALLAAKASPLLRAPLSAWQIAVSSGNLEVAGVLAQHMIPPRCPALSRHKPFLRFDFKLPANPQLVNAHHASSTFASRRLVQVSDEHSPSLKDHLLIDVCSRPGGRCRVAPCVDFLMALGERTCGFQSRHDQIRGADGGGDSETAHGRSPPGARAVHHECIRWLIQAKAALDTETIQRCSVTKLKTLLAAKAALAPSAAMDEEVLRRVISVHPEALNYPTAKDGCTGGWPSHRPLTMAVHLAYGSDMELQQFRLILNAPGIDVNATGPTDGMSALATAAEMGLCLEMNSLLLAKAEVDMPTACRGPLPNAVADVYVRPPLMSAVLERSTGCVRQLLDARADPNTVDVDKNTVLSMAALYGHTPLVKLLLRAKASTGIDITDLEDHTALYGAAQEGHLTEVQILIQAKASVNVSGKDGTPLFIACQENHLSVVQGLLDAKADPTLCLVGIDVGIDAALRLPTSEANGGGEIEEPDQQQNAPGVRWSPLFVAAGSGFLDIVDLLLRHSPTSEAPSSLTMLETCTNQAHFFWDMLVPAGLNPVDIARLRGHSSVVERLLHFRRQQLGN